jgi:hypothetical protein
MQLFAASIIRIRLRVGRRTVRKFARPGFSRCFSVIVAERSAQPFPAINGTLRWDFGVLGPDDFVLQPGGHGGDGFLCGPDGDLLPALRLDSDHRRPSVLCACPSGLPIQPQTTSWRSAPRPEVRISRSWFGLLFNPFRGVFPPGHPCLPVIRREFTFSCTGLSVR